MNGALVGTPVRFVPWTSHLECACRDSHHVKLEIRARDRLGIGFELLPGNRAGRRRGRQFARTRSDKRRGCHCGTLCRRHLQVGGQQGLIGVMADMQVTVDAADALVLAFQVVLVRLDAFLVEVQAVQVLVTAHAGLVVGVRFGVVER